MRLIQVNSPFLIFNFNKLGLTTSIKEIIKMLKYFEFTVFSAF